MVDTFLFIVPTPLLLYAWSLFSTIYQSFELNGLHLLLLQCWISWWSFNKVLGSAVTFWDALVKEKRTKISPKDWTIVYKVWVTLDYSTWVCFDKLFYNYIASTLEEEFIVHTQLSCPKSSYHRVTWLFMCPLSVSIRVALSPLYLFLINVITA